MAEINENQIKRHLEAISKFKVTLEVTAHDIERTRQTLTEQSRHEKGRQSIWRIIMKNKITKLAVAAVIIVAALIGINQFGGSIDGASVAWAGAVEKCHSFKTATYTYTMPGTFFHQEKEYDVIQIKYSSAYGKHKETKIAGNSKSGDYLILTQKIVDDNQVFFIVHETKHYFEYSPSDSQVNDRDIVNILKSLPLKADKVIGTKFIDNKETVGYLLKGHGIDIKIWIDDQTYNPILVEFFDNNTFELEGVYSDFCFDISIDESEFDIQLPEGYSQIDPPAFFLKTKQGSADDFIYYLGLYAKYSEDGCFPDEITISKDKAGLYAIVGLKAIESAKCTELEIEEMSVKGPRAYLFLNRMKPENDWHYAGKGVSPEQSDTPIFWWIENGSEYYTVIFADLGVGTLTEKELP